MGKLVRFLRLPLPEKLLMLRVYLLLWRIRLLLLLPFTRWRRIIGQMKAVRSSSHPLDDGTIRHYASVISATSRYVPGATCLPRALTMQTLLAQRGQESTLQLGVARTPGGKLDAHAWVIVQGRIVIGNQPDLSRFTRLPIPEHL